MTETILVGIALVIVAGIGAQWLAWRLRIPSILILLIIGFLLGPGLNLIDVDALFGAMLFPVVSLSVAIILFEGGLSLNVRELSKVGHTVIGLVSVGALITWGVGSVAAYYLLDLGLGLSVLLGAIVVLTGPTVTGPLLRHIRPEKKLNTILKWEGIVIDPLGAMFAVLVFEALLAGEVQGLTGVASVFILQTIVVGGIIGALAAAILTLLLKYYWIPDYLQNPVSFMVVIASFVISNLLHSESGLLAVTVMGAVLASQRTVSIDHIVEFKENLRVLLISGIFILLAARLRPADLAQINLRSLAFLGVLILIARPLSVFLVTLGRGFTWRERLFLSWMAPRGIIAASVASVFAIELVAAGYSGAERLVPLTFITIVGTVAVYSLTASWVARRLNVAQPNPQGLLIIGAQPWAQAIGAAVQAQGFEVKMVDSNRENVMAARMSGLSTYAGNVLSEKAVNEIELGGIGRLLATTANDEINSLAALHFKPILGRANVYQLPPTKDREQKEHVSRSLQGRTLFSDQSTGRYMAQRFADGAVIKTNHLTDEFDFKAFQGMYGKDTTPLFLIDCDELIVVSSDRSIHPAPGQKLISLVDPVDERLPVEQSLKIGAG
ncbi:MAG TPA: hypothetical protein ENI11_01505 [Actinobacteria bacterium]|nr:hypothetical protein [Actinomycetota bacterium]